MKACRSPEEAVTRRQREPRWSGSPQDEQKLARERRQRRAFWPRGQQVCKAGGKKGRTPYSFNALFCQALSCSLNLRATLR